MDEITYSYEFESFNEESILDTIREYSAIIFDMDGTITSTEDLHFEATNQLSNTKHSWDELYGLCDEDLFKIISPHFDGDLKDFISHKNELIISDLKKREVKKLMKYDFKSLFDKLSDKKLALVTASEHNVAHKLLRHCEIFEYFQCIITTKEVERSKPHPEPYLLALKSLGVTAEDALVFEDSNTGITAANAANIKVAKVNWYS